MKSVRFSVFLLAVLILGGTGCNKPVGVPPNQKADPVATLASWKNGSDIMQQHRKTLSGMWFRDFRPGDVDKVYQDTANKLRAIPTLNVDWRVVDHTNNTIRGIQKIGSTIGTKGNAALRDEFIPDRGGGFGGAGPVYGGLTAQRGKLTGGAVAIEEILSSVDRELKLSEDGVIQHGRLTYNLELRPW